MTRERAMVWSDDVPALGRLRWVDARLTTHRAALVAEIVRLEALLSGLQERASGMGADGALAGGERSSDSDATLVVPRAARVLQ